MITVYFPRYPVRIIIISFNNERFIFDNGNVYREKLT